MRRECVDWLIPLSEAICGVRSTPGSNIRTAGAHIWPSVLACLILQQLEWYRLRSLVIASMTSELFVAQQCSADCTTSTHCVPPELDDGSQQSVTPSHHHCNRCALRFHSPLRSLHSR